MRYDATERILYTNDGTVIKQFSCPLDKRWAILTMTESERIRFCSACDKEVVDISDFDENQILAILDVKPSACMHLDLQRTKLVSVIGNKKTMARCIRDVVESDSIYPNQNPSFLCATLPDENIPVVKTARLLSALNYGVRQGYTPLFLPSELIDSNTEEVSIIFRNSDGEYLDASKLHPRARYGSFYDAPPPPLSPYSPDVYEAKYSTHGSGLAVYLIPPGVNIGDRCFVPDIIEHIPESVTFNYKTNFLKRALGVFNGHGFDFEYTEFTVDDRNKYLPIG